MLFIRNILAPFLKLKYLLIRNSGLKFKIKKLRLICGFFMPFSFYICFMKTLFLIRHAKAVSHSFNLLDFERPLNEQGQKDAAVMAQKLILEGIEIDTFITSTALRAITTCKTFATAYNIEHKEIIALEKLYNAPFEIFNDVIEALNDKINSVAIFGHNPGIMEMASMQTKPMEIIDMPTCGIFAIQIKIDTWKDFKNGSKEKLFFKYPKEY